MADRLLRRLRRETWHTSRSASARSRTGAAHPRTCRDGFGSADCSKCEEIPLFAKMHGLFKTRRDAERDLEQCLTLITADGGTLTTDQE